jgi:diguanylate cyclase (GGDEF)-like protein
MTAAVALFAAHVAVVLVWHGAGSGPVLSDVVQFALGGLLLNATIAAARRSEQFARSFWRMCAAAYTIWMLAQGFGIYMDLSPAAHNFAWITNLMFCFWFAPLAMALFLDPDEGAGGLDSLIALDFVQGVLVCVAAYLYFFYLPKAESPSELAHSVWAPYFVGYGIVVAAFLLRALSTREQAPRQLFGRFGTLLGISGIVDAMFYYGPGRSLKTGAWFDLLWSMMLIFPLLVALSWKQPEIPEVDDLEPARRAKRIRTEIFYLVYPLLVLIMSLRIARERLGLAAIVVFSSFVCSSARLLITQSRLVQTQDALRREASRDGLTGLWNRKAILDILSRELTRSERNSAPLGVIMADVDHFKTVNDSRGHAAGDLVLRIIASEIAAVLRPYDAVGRYGGEEFLIVAPACGMSETWELAERVRECVASCSVIASGASIRVSLSLGTAVATSPVEVETLLHSADVALYQAKNAGRNRVEPSLGRAAAATSHTAVPVQSKFWL